MQEIGPADRLNASGRKSVSVFQLSTDSSFQTSCKKFEFESSGYVCTVE